MFQTFESILQSNWGFVEKPKYFVQKKKDMYTYRYINYNQIKTVDNTGNDLMQELQQF